MSKILTPSGHEVFELIASIQGRLEKLEDLVEKTTPRKAEVHHISARNVEIGKIFIYEKTRFTRIKFTGFLLNSIVVADVMNRGDIFVYNHSSDCVYCFPGNRMVEVPYV